MRKIFTMLLLMLAVITLTGCDLTRPTDGATQTHNATCLTWGTALPSRSRADTQQTIDEIGLEYGQFAATCPDHIHLIPMPPK